MHIPQMPRQQSNFGSKLLHPGRTSTPQPGPGVQYDANFNPVVAPSPGGSRAPSIAPSIASTTASVKGDRKDKDKYKDKDKSKKKNVLKKLF